MVVTAVMVKVKPEHVKEFIAATVENHEKSVIEPGNRRFDICRSIDDPSSFMLYEAYETREAAAAHKQTAHYARWRDVVAPWMAEPRKGIPYESIRP